MQGPELVEAEDAVAVEVDSREDVNYVLQLFRLELVGGLDEELGEVVERNRVGDRFQVRMFLRVDLLHGYLLLAEQAQTACHRAIRQPLRQCQPKVVQSTRRRDQNNFIMLQDLEVEHSLVHDRVQVEV